MKTRDKLIGGTDALTDRWMDGRNIVCVLTGVFSSYFLMYSGLKCEIEDVQNCCLIIIITDKRCTAETLYAELSKGRERTNQSS